MMAAIGCQTQSHWRTWSRWKKTFAVLSPRAFLALFELNIILRANRKLECAFRGYLQIEQKVCELCCCTSKCFRFFGVTNLVRFLAPSDEGVHLAFGAYWGKKAGIFMGNTWSLRFMAVAGRLVMQLHLRNKPLSTTRWNPLFGEGNYELCRIDFLNLVLVSQSSIIIELHFHHHEEVFLSFPARPGWEDMLNRKINAVCHTPGRMMIWQLPTFFLSEDRREVFSMFRS